MFDNDDFDLDDDFLTDVAAKEDEYFSQRQNPEILLASQAKRRKLDSDDLLGDITLDDEPDFARKTPKILTKELTSSSQSKLADILPSENSQSQNHSHLNISLHEKTFQPPASRSQKKSRKASALEVFQKASTDENVFTEISPKPTNRWRPPGFEKIVKRLENVQENRKNSTEFYKKREERGYRKKLVAKKSSKFPIRDNNSTPAPWQTVERKFPGPAGLLPDDLNISVYSKNISPRKILSLLEPETEKETRVTDYCSQRTATLYSSGAWRLMLDDLPSNFLRDNTIVNFKKMSRAQRENSSTSYIAGVVQRIDLRPENPRLVLKDMTGEIEATMHSDVPCTHPNVFEPGVVILLRRPALLDFKGNEFASKYHLMISLRSLLAVYSDKARLITSPWIEAQRANTITSGDSSETTVNEEQNKKILAQRNTAFDDNLEMDWSDEDPSINSRDINDSQNSVSERFASFGTAENVGEIKVTTTAIIERKKSLEIIKPSISSDEKSLNQRNIENKHSEIDKIEAKGMQIRSKLLQFRSNDVLTPVQEDKVKETSPLINANIENSTEINTEEDKRLPSFGDHLLFDDDSDDEILSQLDVDAIAMTYST